MRRSLRALTAALLLTAVIGAAGCKGGRFNNMFSRSDEIKMGQQFAKQYAQENKGKFVTSGASYERLQRVAARILPLARRSWDVPYEVHLVESKEINAFAVPGGPIYFYTGLMDLAASDDEVAAVMGHEVTHTVKRHSARQISDAQGKAAIAEILLGNSSQNTQGLAGLFLGVTSLKYSRDDESQADEYGFSYLVTAGYRPEAMATFFQKMQEKTGKGGPEWLANHPLTRKRIERAEQRAAAYRAGTYIAP